MTWDAQGRLTKVVQGTREITYAYDAAKPQRLVSRTDGENHTSPTATTTRADHVGHGRRPDVRLHLRRHRQSHRVTMPNGKTHAYGYSATAAVTSYTPPGAGAQLTGYDDDHYQASTTLPGRGTTTFARKTDGRLTGVGDATWGYENATDRFTSATRGGKTEVVRYDGGLKTAVGEHTYVRATRCAAARCSSPARRSWTSATTATGW